ncbi:MAG: class I SAM-dependent DNA methyltransferase [Lachnospiraceae bacterium]
MEQQEAYTGFAAVYDQFMDEIPYEDWCEYIKGILKEEKIEDGLVLELGCGTGIMTELLASAGYDMIGLDNSIEMLDLAREKKQESGHDILYLLQDMREFELYGTVRAIVSVCDSMNYILEEADLEQVFRLVNNYLDPKGIFVFDLKTQYYFEQIVGDRTFGETQEESCFIWENYFYEDERINEYAMTIFRREEDGRYSRSNEIHYQKAWHLEEIKTLLERAGLEFVAAYDGMSRNVPKRRCERMYIVAREHGKKEV